MGLLSYMKPGKGKTDERPSHAQPRMAEQHRSGTSLQGSDTPGSATPGGATPWGSRPASIYPMGDFRNSQAESIHEIKCDVMVNWLYQQQMEKLWTAGGYDEGVVLKKGRSSYTCCPADITENSDGFFQAVENLNVKVSC